MTTQLLDALEHPGAAFLAELLDGPATEAQLVHAVDGASQPTANRRLAALQAIGLTARERSGNWRAPGRQWTLNHPEETDALLQSAHALADAIAETDRAEREKAKRRLRRARASRRGLRDVGRDSG